MGRLHVVIPDDLHRKLKHRAIDEGKSVKQLVIEILEKYFNVEGKR